MIKGFSKSVSFLLFFFDVLVGASAGCGFMSVSGAEQVSSRTEQLQSAVTGGDLSVEHKATISPISKTAVQEATILALHFKSGSPYIRTTNAGG